MKQGTLPSSSKQTDSLHVAIIMDGNGRWATARGRPRIAGHRAGAAAVRRTVETAPHLGIRTLTLYAFSSDNWRRPQREVETLFQLFKEHLRSETAKCLDNGIRINVIGRRDRLPAGLLREIENAEQVTTRVNKLDLRIAVDYSARDTIVRAALNLNGSKEVSREHFARLMAGAEHSARAVPEVDLLIRTGGEQRLSDFLLWECAYAELLFVPTMWPDFGESDLKRAIEEFRHRERRFGGLPAAVGL